MNSFCPGCGTPLRPDWKVCAGCGKQLADPAPQRRCLRCGKTGDTTFCPDCGGKMTETAPTDITARLQILK